MRNKRLSDAVEFRPVTDKALINTIYHDPDIADRILHDGVEEYYNDHPSIKYFGAFVDGKIVGVFQVIWGMVNCDIHFAILKEYALYHRLFCEWCIDTVFEMGIHRITLSVTDYARKMCNLAIKLGFQYEGCRREGFLKDGKLYDIHMLGMTRDDWGMIWEKQ